MIATEVRSITITGARAIWKETIGDDDDLVKVIRIVESELMARNKVSLIVIVSNPYTQLAIVEE